MSIFIFNKKKNGIEVALLLGYECFHATVKLVPSEDKGDGSALTVPPLVTIVIS